MEEKLARQIIEEKTGKKEKLWREGTKSLFIVYINYVCAK